MKTDIEIAKLLAVAERFFTSPEYAATVNEARGFWVEGRAYLAANALAKLPTAEKLLDRLIEKLKGKSVEKTLKAIREGKAADNPVVEMMGLSSLLTHVLIEMKQGHREYGVLVPVIFEKMGGRVYSL